MRCRSFELLTIGMIACLGTLNFAEAEEASCSSDATKSIVLDIYKNKILGPYIKILNLDETTFTLQYIRTTDKKTNASSCKAELAMHLVFVPGLGGGNPDQTEPIEYTVEITDDGQPYGTISRK